MPLKNLAVLDHPNVQSVYPYLHVPVDKCVYDEAVRKRIKRLTSWSRLDRDKYITDQKDLRKMVRVKGKYSCALEWEADAWVTRASTT